MDGPTAQYLHPIAGLDAAMWVPSSRGQLFWLWRAPWAWLLFAGALQAGSHILEPLPPRVTRSVHWIPPVEYLLGRAGHRNPPGTAARRACQFAAQAVFGTVDEIVASPRLMPVLLLELLWLFGHVPVRHAAWRTLSARAIASGNPALDYIGIGGPTPLRALA